MLFCCPPWASAVSLPSAVSIVVEEPVPRVERRFDGRAELLAEHDVRQERCGEAERRCLRGQLCGRFDEPLAHEACGIGRIRNDLERQTDPDRNRSHDRQGNAVVEQSGFAMSHGRPPYCEFGHQQQCLSQYYKFENCVSNFVIKTGLVDN